MRFLQLPRIVDCRDARSRRVLFEALLEYVKGRTLAQVVAGASPGRYRDMLRARAHPLPIL